VSLGKRHKVLVFGNEMLKNDSLPLRLLADLGRKFPDIEFKAFDPNDNMESEGREINIIDTVEGIDKVTLVTDIDSIKINRVLTMHDYDLGYNLRLLKKLNYIDSVLIFGVPMKIKKEEALKQLSAAIRANLS
jgi:Ni,Fe-hydrogenase maturation factor